MMEIPESAITIGTLIPLLSIFMGGLVVLVTAIGVTARFALKPAVEALAALQALHATMDQVGSASRQVEEPSRAVKQLQEQLLDSGLPAGEGPRDEAA